MKQLHVFLVSGILLGFHTQSQPTAPLKNADSCYKAKAYGKAAILYVVAAENSRWNSEKKNDYYNAACCFALSNQKDRAINSLHKSVYDYGYSNYDNLKADSDLVALHNEEEWVAISDYLLKYKNSLSEPRNAKLVTSDIHNFWEAYDSAQKNTINQETIFERYYFNNASPGLQDYFVLKIKSVRSFVKNLDSKPKFYRAIRFNTLAIDTMKENIYRSFEKLKALYADATFPNIYFMIGRWNSAGTTSDNGLLIGVDQIVKSPEIPLDELNLWERNNFQEKDKLPVIVAHELIHFEQSGLPQDSTLLANAIVEGMADFLGEMICGKNPNQRLQEFAKGKRKQIWEEFKKEMYLDRSGNWIANANQETAERPADLG
ncbi:MAG: hypothetical protein C5B52_08380, partial [Bacteroidetes bacterium]